MVKIDVGLQLRKLSQN